MPTFTKKKPPETPVTPCEALRAEVSKYPDWDVNIMVAIGHEEGYYQGIRCNPKARGDGHLTYTVDGRTYGYSLSALQVRILPGRERCDKLNLKTNVKCAHEIWKGQGYAAWTMYTNGAYRKWLK